MQPNIVSHANGLFEGLNVIFYRLQWAESSPLVRSNSLKRRANAGIFSAAILAAYVGQHGILVRQLIACSMANVGPFPIGPRGGLCAISHRPLWASSNPLPIGPYEGLHAISLEANSSPSPIGPCEGLHDISYRLLLADSSPSVEAIH